MYQRKTNGITLSDNKRNAKKDHRWSFFHSHEQFDVIHLGMDIKQGDHYEDCGFIIRRCVSSDTSNDELIGVSLFDGTEGRCSIRHCGPEMVSRVTAEKAAEVYGSNPMNYMRMRENEYSTDEFLVFLKGY